ncbi:hypothetical protein SUGI_0581150 [Cryptomeria japonica]|nr:hypothetical protein SUGI_0581150 [Cryptomeria japonica]
MKALNCLIFSRHSRAGRRARWNLLVFGALVAEIWGAIAGTVHGPTKDELFLSRQLGSAEASRGLRGGTSDSHRRSMKIERLNFLQRMR